MGGRARTSSPRRTPLAQITPGGYPWPQSEDIRDEERVSDQRALARAEYDRAGWVRFAGMVLVTLGAFQIINGLIALFRSGTYAVGESGLVVDVDYTTWGWVHIVLGGLAMAVVPA